MTIIVPWSIIGTAAAVGYVVCLIVTEIRDRLDARRHGLCYCADCTFDMVEELERRYEQERD